MKRRKRPIRESVGVTTIGARKAAACVIREKRITKMGADDLAIGLCRYARRFSCCDCRRSGMVVKLPRGVLHGMGVA